MILMNFVKFMILMNKVFKLKTKNNKILKMNKNIIQQYILIIYNTLHENVLLNLYFYVKHF